MTVIAKIGLDDWIVNGQWNLFRSICICIMNIYSIFGVRSTYSKICYLLLQLRETFQQLLSNCHSFGNCVDERKIRGEKEGIFGTVHLRITP